jgi:hypothetical protein
LILIGTASTSDAIMWDNALALLIDNVAIGVVFLGDNAFQDSKLIVTPYAVWHITVMDAVGKAAAGTSITITAAEE